MVPKVQPWLKRVVSPGSDRRQPISVGVAADYLDPLALRLLLEFHESVGAGRWVALRIEDLSLNIGPIGSVDPVGVLMGAASNCDDREDEERSSHRRRFLCWLSRQPQWSTNGFYIRVC